MFFKTLAVTATTAADVVDDDVDDHNNEVSE
jgi:hypothetical protein